MGNQGESYRFTLSPFEAAVVMRLRQLRQEQAWGELMLRFRDGCMTMAAFHATETPDQFLDILAHTELQQEEVPHAEQGPRKARQ